MQFIASKYATSCRFFSTVATNPTQGSFLRLEPKTLQEKASEKLRDGSDVDSEVHNQALFSTFREILFCSNELVLKRQVFDYLVVANDDVSLPQSVREDVNGILEILRDLNGEGPYELTTYRRWTIRD